MQRFEAVIEAANGGGAYVPVPAAVIAALGGGGRIKVQATFDDIAYRGSITNMGAGPCLGMLKGIRDEIGKGPGDAVVVTVAPDTAARTVVVPEDLAIALETAGVRAGFDQLSYTDRRQLVAAITEAKRPDTRVRRIEKAVAASS
ncbi:YdeI/OmpD-associated family protein [Nocardia sp. NPDC051832]|uniref:YdeI/OmpD-associated family protein n=1 Tax=Nocardia sp. NPDC051832 TaxID=3155673 RepID=UPI00341F7999